MTSDAAARRRSWRSRRATRGVASVEFAIVLLPFCLILFGVVDYGWYFCVKLASTNAVREGTRAATTIAGPCPNNAAKAEGLAAIANYFTTVVPGVPAPTVTYTCTTLTGGDPRMKFTLQADFPPITGLSLIPLPQGAPGMVRVNTSSVMRGVP